MTNKIAVIIKAMNKYVSNELKYGSSVLTSINNSIE